MSRPPAGKYIIYNRVLSPTGQKLAIIFQGDDKFATVEAFAHTGNQVWELQDHGPETQAVIPVNATSLQAAWGDQGVKVIRAGGYVWIIKDGSEGYTIQDGGRTANWGVDKANVGEKVAPIRGGSYPLSGAPAGGPWQSNVT